jgi:hypothetical protein
MVRKKLGKRKSLRAPPRAQAKTKPEALAPPQPAATEWSLLTPSELSAWPTYADGDLVIPFAPWHQLGAAKPTDEQERRFREMAGQLRVESLRRRYVKPLDDWTAACEREQASLTPPLTFRPAPAPYQNPVYVWRAYAECRNRNARLPIPEWVLEYLDGPAHAFWYWSMDGRIPPKMKNLGEALVKAFDMRPLDREPGPGNVFAEIFPDLDNRRLAEEVHFRVRRNGEQLKNAIPAVVTEYKVSFSKVQRAWLQYKDELAGIGEVSPALSPAQSALVSQKLGSLLGGNY